MPSTCRVKVEKMIATGRIDMVVETTSDERGVLDGSLCCSISDKYKSPPTWGKFYIASHFTKLSPKAEDKD